MVLVLPASSSPQAPQTVSNVIQAESSESLREDGEDTLSGADGMFSLGNEAARVRKMSTSTMSLLDVLESRRCCFRRQEANPRLMARLGSGTPTPPTSTLQQGNSARVGPPERSLAA
jgi:hypothetical protein